MIKGLELENHLIWIDLEMSGLDPERDVILQIASVVTNSLLDIIAEGPEIVIQHPENILSSMDDWNREHHESSGLIERVRVSTYRCHGAEDQTIDFLRRYSKKKQSPLCGNSVWQDRRFLIKHMPRLEAFFHYRIIDVSAIKELVRRWYPTLPPFTKRKSHQALSDIRESIQELKYYRQNVFIQESEK